MSTLSIFTERQRQACASAADRIDKAIADDRLDQCYIGRDAAAALSKVWVHGVPEGVTLTGRLGRRWVGGDVERVARDLRWIARRRYWRVSGYWRFDVDGLTGSIYSRRNKWDIFLDDGRHTCHLGLGSLAQAKGFIETIVAARGTDR
jgi:hypothetical protein